MRMLRLRDDSQYAALKENRWGIREFTPEQVVGLEEGTHGSFTSSRFLGRLIQSNISLGS